MIDKRLMGWLGLGTALWLGASGCNGVDPPQTLPDPLSRAAALAAYNANVAAICAFKARIRQWEISYRDIDGEKQKTFKGNAGTVIFRPAGTDVFPMLYLQADPLIGSEALVLCVNATEYWLYSGQSREGWWGKLAHSGKACAQTGILNLHLLLGLLGFEAIADEPLAPPYLMYKVGAQTHTIYVTDDALRLRREAVFDRRNNLLQEVRVYDEAGVNVIWGRLGDYHPLGEAQIPGSIALHDLANNAHLHLKLHHYRDDSAARREALFDRSRIGLEPEHFEQIDRACDHE